MYSFIIAYAKPTESGCNVPHKFNESNCDRTFLYFSFSLILITWI